jgi:DNA polymerase-3 subunit gamma/tau
MIGQEYVVKILKAQVENGRIGHAYLFCGARGTGKTSAAKILAKAVNCQNPSAGSPCGECPACKALSGPGGLDVLEIDAASNNKVEEIRDLREKIQYPPVNCKYKVYIIDEVHMLTDSAFNALLKTLEEPPAHAVFILATTEAYKLPATILSRCMRFDFRLVPLKEIEKLLLSVFKEIGKEAEPEAVREIARAAEGSVRDALSIADMCVSYGAGALLYADVLALLSASDAGRVRGLTASLLAGDAAAALQTIDELACGGKSISVLNKDIIAYLRDLAVIKCVPSAENILNYPADILRQAEKHAEGAGLQKILSAVEVFSALEADLKYSLHPRVLFEAAALKALRLKSAADFDGILKRLEALEQKLSAAAPNRPAGAAAPAKRRENIPEPPTQNMPESEPPYNAPIPQDTEAVPDKKPSGDRSGAGLWGTVLRKLRQQSMHLLYTACGELSGEICGKDFIIRSANPLSTDILQKPKNMEIIRRMIAEEGEYNIIIRGEKDKKSLPDGDIEALQELAGGRLKIE